MAKLARILDGGRDDGVSTAGALGVAETYLRENGWEVDVLRLSEIEIAPCLGCFSCWIKTPGVCVIDDAGRDVARRIVQSDLVLYLTPILFGGYAPDLKKALDRSIPNVLPLFQRVKGEIHHVKRYARCPRLAGIGILPDRNDEEGEIFETLIRRNAINMHAPAVESTVYSVTDTDDTVKRRIEWALSEVI
ncbi:flavodoxin family protein [Candidatus Bipolaricaulota bacterium]